MDESKQQVAYLIFDVEAVADGALVKRVRYPNEDLDPEAAIKKYRAELMEKYGNDVIPPTFVVPAAVAVAKVDPSFRIGDPDEVEEFERSHPRLRSG